MRSSRNQVSSASHALPEVRFEDQDMTSFGGLVVLQAVINGLDIKGRLRGCVRHLKTSAAYSYSRILLVLVVHTFLGWRRLRDLDYYGDDPMVQRVLGLKRLPDVSTISRRLGEFDATAVDNLRSLQRDLTGTRARSASPGRLTLDFDGSTFSTKARRIEGTAIGYNTKHKGCRSYYPLFATIAQTGQVFDVLHRPGNCHDSRGAEEFIIECFRQLRDSGFRGVREARLDSAHFSDETCAALDDEGIEFSMSVPFERIPELKAVVEERRAWRRIDDEWSYFDWTWRVTKQSKRIYNCVVYRHRVAKPVQGPIQLNLFKPVEREYEYKVVLTNKTIDAAALLAFHNGRGSQESTFGELKTDLAMDYLPSRRLVGNQVWLLTSLLAHTLTREMQMQAETPRHDKNTPTRAALWLLERVATVRKRIIQRAARITRPAGRLVLTLATNSVVEDHIRRLLRPWRKAA
jgi:Transposase DDE domain group 1